jgi:hypothetical protein
VNGEGVMTISFESKDLETVARFVSAANEILLKGSAWTLTIKATPQGAYSVRAVTESYDGGSKTQSGSEPQPTTSKTPHWLAKGALG